MFSLVHYRKILTLVLIYAFLLPFLFSCENIRLAGKISHLRRNEIVIPPKMIVLKDGKKRFLDSSSLPDILFVILLDSEDCQSCFFGHREYMQSLSALEDKYPDFRSLLIVEGLLDDNILEDFDNMDEYVKSRVCFDTSSDFYALNPDFPEDKRFQCFLLDSSRHPVFFGNPFSGRKVWDSFNTELADLAIL